MIDSLEQEAVECITCTISKITRESFPAISVENRKFSQPLDLVHMDVCSISCKTRRGKSSFLCLVDDFSRTVCIILLKKKEVIKHLKSWKPCVERQTGFNIKAIKSDNGFDFCCKKMVQFLKEQGIEHLRTNVASPEMNGVAE